MTDRLKKLLGDFESRVAKENAEEKTRLDSEGREREACASRLVTIVKPVLVRFTAELQSAGHRAEIGERIGSYMYPSIELSYTPNRKEPGSGRTMLMESKLGFQCSGSTIKTRLTVYQPKASGGTSRENDGPSVGASMVSEDWVEAQVLAFIGEVLRTS